MEGIGQVVARRGGSPGASEVPGIGSPVSSDMLSRPSVRKPSTAAGPASDPSWNAGLLLGFESLHGLGKPGPEEALGLLHKQPSERGESTPAEELVPGVLHKQSSGRGESTPAEEPVPGLLHKQSSGRGESTPAEEPVPGLLHKQSSGRGESTLTEEPAAGLSAVSAAAGAAVLEAALLEGAAATDALRSIAADEVRLLGFVEAADFAGRVEEISRSVEYLQVVAAQAVERSRKQAQQAGPGSTAAAPEWRTGWTEHVPDSKVTAPASVVDDGYRNTAEFLRARLRIGIGEARRRLALATDALSHTGMTGQDVPARREALADALASGELSSRSASIISTALDKVRHLADEEMLTRMEHALTATAVESDPDFVSKMARRWTDLIDHDGPEPTEEALRQHQGAFLRRRRRYGLHHIEIFATDEQYETLTTAMNTATNPRLTTAPPDTAPASSPITGAGHGRANETSHGHGPHASPAHASPVHASPTHASAVFSPASTDSAGKDTADGPDLDRRSRAQKLLDGLVGACSVAMSTGKLPSNGGLRPQVTVTIDHRDLFTQLTGPGHAAQNRTTRQADQSSGSATAPNQPNTPNQPGTGASRYRPSTGTATFLGPIHPTTIRKIACDADIIPVLLGSDSRILDIGRTTRIFPPHIRKAITARDQGCTFPDCTMPAPWCEAHHTTYWSHGGTTGTDNGTLLCSHHHHIIHKEQWRIDMTTGAPWFIPPPHIDPHQKPRRNHHHTPQRT